MKRRTIHCFAAAGWLVVIASLLASCAGKGARARQPERTGMILEPLERAGNYYGAHPAFKKAFEFLQQEDLAEKPSGRYELDGDRVFCMISRDIGKKKKDARLEAHRKYIDIQYVIAGEEQYGWKPFDRCSGIEQAYDAGRDIMFFNDAPTTWTPVPPGSFAIFFPEEDAHAPMVGTGMIHKVVIKVLKDG